MPEDRAKADDGGNRLSAAMDPRVLFAAERTLLAWIRTGLALMGFGFVVARFGLFMRELTAVRDPAPPYHGGLSLWAGIVMVILGVFVNVLAALQHLQSMRRLQAGQPLYPGRFTLGIVLSLVLAILGIAMALYLVLMPGVSVQPPAGAAR